MLQNLLLMLYKSFLSSLGVKIRHSTPLHSQANGLAERCIQTIEQTLHTVLVSDKPKTWHEVLPSCVFAYNTAVSSTTSVSPFQLMFGRLPRGPIQVLKDNWLENIDEWPSLSKSSNVLLTDVHDNFKVGVDIALAASDKSQRAYALQYNKRAKHKQFVVGDQVLILLPDSSHKLNAQ